MLTLINHVERAEPFDHSDWGFEAKFDGFRAAADTVRDRLISRNGNRMQLFERVLSRTGPPRSAYSHPCWTQRSRLRSPTGAVPTPSKIH
jgi:hypothetical protein